MKIIQRKKCCYVCDDCGKEFKKPVITEEYKIIIACCPYCHSDNIVEQFNFKVETK